MTETTAGPELVVSRSLRAPRELVYRAWTNPRHIVQWWGPNGFTTTMIEMDVRVGGLWRFIMHGPDGTDYPNRNVYVEIVPNQRLVFRHAWAQEGWAQEGWDQEGSNKEGWNKEGREKEGADEPGAPGPFLHTVTFDETPDGTNLTMRMVFPSAQERDEIALKFGAVEGANQTLARLDAYLPQMSQIPAAQPETFTLTRVFNAPRQRVWQAFTEMEHLKHWWGPKGFTWVSAKLDLRPGGVFHYCMQSPDGQKMWGRFVYQEVTPPERLVFVNSFSNEQGEITRNPYSATWPAEVHNTLLLSESDGQTALTMSGHPINATEEERKTFGNMHSSLEKGFGATFDQLAEFLQNGFSQESAL